MATPITDTFLVMKVFLVLVILPLTMSFSFDRSQAMKLKESLENEDIGTDSVSEEVKEFYYEDFVEKSSAFKRVDTFSENSLAQKNDLDLIAEILSLLEYKDIEVERESDKLNEHLKSLEQKVFGFEKRVFIDFISWQRHLNLHTPSGKNKLVVTNRGVCAGGSLNYANAHATYGIGGCFIAGEGDVSNTKPAPAYREGDIPLTGLNLSLSAGMFVSPARAELGVKLPVLYSQQRFDDPSEAGYSIEEDDELKAALNLYFRHPIGKAFIQSEIGQFLDQSTTLYSVGLGMKF